MKTVREVMSTALVTVNPSAMMIEAARVMSEAGEPSRSLGDLAGERHDVRVTVQPDRDRQMAHRLGHLLRMGSLIDPAQRWPTEWIRRLRIEIGESLSRGCLRDYLRR
jgi:CBS domain-containing protein